MADGFFFHVGEGFESLAKVSGPNPSELGPFAFGIFGDRAAGFSCSPRKGFQKPGVVHRIVLGFVAVLFKSREHQATSSFGDIRTI